LSHNGRIQISGEAVLFAVAEIPDTVSSKTLEDMDRAIENFKMNKVSAPIDL
jgi:hypothetical protein